MKYYCINYFMDEEIHCQYGTNIKKSEEFPTMMEITGIVKKYYKQNIPLSVLVNIDTIYTVYEVDDKTADLKVVSSGGIKDEDVHD